jgi:hypothetical protein
VIIDDPRIASIPIDDQWIAEAAQELRSYPSAPFVNKFMTRNGLNPDTFSTTSARITEITACILSPDHQLRLDDLVTYLDEIKGYGRQFICLWRLKAGQQAWLASLRESAAVEQILGEQSDRLNHRRLVYGSAVPELVEVRHSPSGTRPSLRFEWAATRQYFVLVPSQDPAALPHPVPHTQRAATFFSIDLKTGDCELRIQSLPSQGQGLPSQREEVQRYCAEVARFMDLSRFAPVLIEPVAKRWLREPPLQVQNWRAVRADGSYLAGGGRGRTAFPKLSVLLGEFFARDLALMWPCTQKAVRRRFFFSLDGQTDIVDFNGVADASRVDFVLEQIRNSPPDQLTMRELRNLAMRYPEHARILAALDFHFTVQTRLRVMLKELTDELWYAPRTIRSVMGLVAREVPSRFSLTGVGGDVLEIDNRLRVLEGGLVEKLRRKADGEGKDQAKTMVKPMLSAGYLLFLLLVSVLTNWLTEEMFVHLTGVPFILVQVGVVGVLAVAHAGITFGGRAVREFFGRLVAAARSLYRWVRLLLAGARLPGFIQVLETIYQNWLARAEETGHTWPLGQVAVPAKEANHAWSENASPTQGRRPFRKARRVPGSPGKPGRGSGARKTEWDRGP